MIAKFREKLFVKKGYTWNPATCSCENGRYERSIFGDLAIICYAIIGTTKSILTKTAQVKSILPNLKEKKQSLKFYIFYILLAFLLISMTIIDIISKHLLLFHDTNIKFKVGY